MIVFILYFCDINYWLLYSLPYLFGIAGFKPQSSLPYFLIPVLTYLTSHIFYRMIWDASSKSSSYLHTSISVYLFYQHQIYYAQNLHYISSSNHSSVLLYIITFEIFITHTKPPLSLYICLSISFHFHFRLVIKFTIYVLTLSSTHLFRTLIIGNLTHCLLYSESYQSLKNISLPYLLRYRIIRYNTHLNHCKHQLNL